MGHCQWQRNFFYDFRGFLAMPQTAGGSAFLSRRIVVSEVISLFNHRSSDACRLSLSPLISHSMALAKWYCDITVFSVSV